MPWTAENATEHTKSAKSAKQKRQWAKVANSMLKSGKSEGSAIRAANAAVGDAWSQEAREAAAEARKRGASNRSRIEQSVQAGLASFRRGQAKLASRKASPGYKKKVAEINQRLHAAMSRRFGGGGHGIGGLAGKRVAVAYGPIDAAIKLLADARKKITQRDPRGREVATFEEEDGLVKVATDAAGASVLRMCDTVEFDDASMVRLTADGFLTARPRIARTGIQVYRGDECARKDVDSVRVYRPADSVFHKDAMHSYTHRPVTLDHPPVTVNAANWKEYAVGSTGDEVIREGGTVRVPMTLMDKRAIDAFKSGTNQLSVGYDCDLDWTPGVTEDGEQYDAVQRNIRANHLAVVAAARGGPTLKIGDDQEQELPMNLRTITVDGFECQMSDVAATVVKRVIDKLTQDYNELAELYDQDKKKKKEEDDEQSETEDKLKDAIKAKDAEIATLQQQLKDANDPKRRDAELKDLLAVADKAKKLMGGKLSTDGKQVADIRREVVNAKMGDRAKDWSDIEIAASFNTLDAGSASSGSNPIADARAAFSGRAVNLNDAREAAYQRVAERDANAWKAGKFA